MKKGKLWPAGLLILTLILGSNGLCPHPGLAQEDDEPPPPVTPEWQNTYEDALTAAQSQQRLLLIVFCNDQRTEDALRNVKINQISAGSVIKIEKDRIPVRDFIYALIRLSDKESIALTKFLKKGNKAETPDDPDFSALCQLALDYKVKTFPQLFFCDAYGNELGRSPQFNPKQIGPEVEKGRPDMMKVQIALENNIKLTFPPVEKAFEREQKKNEFTPGTITKLNKFAGYRGKEKSYEAVLKAREYLKTINDRAETELEEIIKNNESGDNPKTKPDLTKLKKKYPGLPVCDKIDEELSKLK
jgi:hypothetical protein